MKYRVKVSDQEYLVEVVDLTKNPVIAIVNGKEIPVYLEQNIVPAEVKTQDNNDNRNASTQPKLAPPSSASGKLVLAPLPGVIVAIKVSQNEDINIGDELCVIEAMKMNNVIKASRAGKISRVLVHSGQIVRHRELLFEFE